MQGRFVLVPKLSLNLVCEPRYSPDETEAKKRAREGSEGMREEGHLVNVYVQTGGRRGEEEGNDKSEL